MLKLEATSKVALKYKVLESPVTHKLLSHILVSRKFFSKSFFQHRDILKTLTVKDHFYFTPFLSSLPKT